jgi:hypothetical protein
MSKRAQGRRAGIIYPFSRSAVILANIFLIFSGFRVSGAVRDAAFVPTDKVGKTEGVRLIVSRPLIRGRSKRTIALGSQRMYLTAIKLARSLFWLALAVGILALLMPKIVPVGVAVGLAAAWGGLFLYGIVHVRLTRRWGLRCPECGWVPFALEVWKCKQCRFVWDTFATEGVCPRCGHRHDEMSCLRCRRISPARRWKVKGAG